MSHSRVSGAVDAQGRYVSFEGDIRDCAEFALWCSSLAPSGDWLLCCDQGHLHLEPHTTVADIVRACTGNVEASPDSGRR